jgi:hypothetical protein
MQGIILGNLGYTPIPKVACTSIKHAIFTALNDRDFVDGEDHRSHIHDYFGGKQRSITSCSIRTVVLRDPVKRLLSAYSNRVLHHRELSYDKVAPLGPKVYGTLPAFNPTLEEFIDQFEEYMAVPAISHHAKPIADVIQCELNEFTHIYPIEQITQFASLLEGHLQKKIFLPRLQTGGAKLCLGNLSRAQLEKLIEFYRRDYELLAPYYSTDAIWKQFKEAN